MEARAALGLRQRHVLVNVKRLHPLAGQKFLLEALGEVVRTHPDTRLVICGTGPLLDELKSVARTSGVEAHVTFAGLVTNQTIAQYDAAADVFVLPSQLEACPTVALEALASGTPVVSTDNPGGVELGEIFGYDVTVVPRENPLALARAIIAVLDQKRRVRESTRRILEQEFRPSAVERQFREIYTSVRRPRKHLTKDQTTMALIDDISRGITEAMKSRDQDVLGTLRMLKSALTIHGVEKGRAPGAGESLQVVVNAS